MATRQAFAQAGINYTNQASATITTWAAGDTCVAFVIWYGTQTLSSVSLAGESNLTLIGSHYAGTILDARMQWAVLDNVTGSGSKQLTATLSANSIIKLMVWRLSGCNTTDAYDTHANASGTGPSPTVSTLNLTTANDSALIIAAGTSDSGIAIATPGSGYTIEAVTHYYVYEDAQYDENVGTAGSKTVSATWTGNGSGWDWSAIAINNAAGGAAGIKPFLGKQMTGGFFDMTGGTN